jgi:hypothetical protein
MLKLGGELEQVIEQVRTARPGAIENKKQEEFLAGFAASVKNGG